MEKPSHASDLRAGDLVGLSGCNLLGLAINLCTWGLPPRGISHIAIVAHDRPPMMAIPAPARRRRQGPEQIPDPAARLVLWESTAHYHAPCVIRGQRTDGVQAHPIRPRLMDLWRQGRVWHFPADPPLNRIEAQILAGWSHKQLGTPYDYLGAFRARDLALGILRRWIAGREQLQSDFCSEFCAAALRAVGRFETANASAWNPNSLTRELERQRAVLPRRRLVPKGA